MMNDVIRNRWSCIKANEDFICIETNSGYGAMSRWDPKGKQYLLLPNIGNQKLGEALLDTLAHSRFVLGAPREGSTYSPDVEFDMGFYDYKLTSERYAQWIKNLMDLYNYKTKRALFKNLKSCSIQSIEGIITIKPSHHEKLEVWNGDGITEADYVVTPSNSSPEEIGAAIQLALSRCT